MIEKYRRRVLQRGNNFAESLKGRADVIKDSVFHRDIGYRVCYILKNGEIFPRQNETEYIKAKNVFFGKDQYDPKYMDQFQAIDCKFSVHQYKAISSSDDPDYYLEFRPNAHASNHNIRVGALVFIPDDLGVYNLWMIVATDKRPQFPQYYVLQVNWLLKFGRYNATKGERPQIMFQWCINRARNSYNSGVWTDYISTSVENQDSMWLSTNAISRHIWYDTRLIIDDESRATANVVAWKVSKVERTHPIGISKFTVTQELYDSEDWCVRIIDSGIVTDQPDGSLMLDYYYCGRIDGIGMDAIGKSEIKYVGSGTLRVGHSKTFTAFFFNDEDGMDVSEDAEPIWTIISSDGDEYSREQLQDIPGYECTITNDGDQIILKCSKDYDLIGDKVLVKLSDANHNRISTVEIEVIG